MSNPSTSTSRSSRSDITAELRAAGCVFAEDEARLLEAAARTPDELHDMVARRIAGLPLEHVLGWAEFAGRRVVVEPGVFVPRRRTEFLVEQAAALAPEGAVVMDLCCGSGAVGLALLSILSRIELHATDVDPAATRCARRNLAGRGRVYEGDLYQPLPRELRARVDVLVANAPYVPTDAIATMPPEARVFEPAVALDGGADGLEVLRRIVADAPSWLAPSGHLLIETSAGQSTDAVAEFVRAGLKASAVSSDEFEATVVIGTRTDQSPSDDSGPAGGRAG